VLPETLCYINLYNTELLSTYIFQTLADFPGAVIILAACINVLMASLYCVVFFKRQDMTEQNKSLDLDLELENDAEKTRPVNSTKNTDDEVIPDNISTTTSL
jgi:hypothetical protein